MRAKELAFCVGLAVTVMTTGCATYQDEYKVLRGEELRKVTECANKHNAVSQMLLPNTIYMKCYKENVK